MEPALETHRSKKMEPPLFIHAMSNSPWLDLRETIITIDATGCKKLIAKQIIEGGDYVFAVKGDHPKLSEKISLLHLNRSSLRLRSARRSCVAKHEVVRKSYFAQ